MVNPRVHNERRKLNSQGTDYGSALRSVSEDAPDGTPKPTLTGVMSRARSAAASLIAERELRKIERQDVASRSEYDYRFDR